MDTFCVFDLNLLVWEKRKKNIYKKPQNYISILIPFDVNAEFVILSWSLILTEAHNSFPIERSDKAKKTNLSDDISICFFDIN